MASCDTLSTRVLQCHSDGSRCTVEITLETGRGPRQLIGKMYATDRADVLEAMRGIRRAGFGPEQEFSIPDPLGYLRELNLLVLEHVPGPRARDIFVAGSQEDRAEAAARCARWLARFHAAAPAAGPMYDLGGHLSSLERCSRRLAQLDARVADKAGRLFGQLRPAAAALGSMAACAGHGSFSPSQVILTPTRVATFDWDGYGVAPPGRDVARFLVALRRLALGRLGSIRALDEAAAIFVAAYRAEARWDVAPTLRFFRPATAMQLAEYNLKHKVRHWREKAEAMVDEGLRMLEEE